MKKSIWVIVFFLWVTNAQASYDVYVDKNNITGTEDGTETFPFNTLSEGVAKALENSENLRKIWVAAGEYQEQIELGEGVELYGAGNNRVTIIGKTAEGAHYNWTVKMHDHTKIQGVGIKYGRQGVLVASGASVKIDDCRIFKSQLNGIYVEKAKTNREDFILKDSKIYDSKKRGMYIQKKEVKIENNEIYDNNEEGIDLRSSVKGVIKDNEITDNGESGLEMELRNNDLRIKNNKFFSNKTNGVNFQYRGKNKAGQVVMTGNKIQKNKHYGVRCGAPSGGKPEASFFSFSVNLSKNIFKDNKMATYSNYCNF